MSRSHRPHLGKTNIYFPDGAVFHTKKDQAVPLDLSLAPIADTHFHLTHLEEIDAAYALVRAALVGVRLFVCPLDVSDEIPQIWPTVTDCLIWFSEVKARAEKLAEDIPELSDKKDLFKHLHVLGGVHPLHADGYNKQSEARLLELLDHPMCVGVGEIGLDFGPYGTIAEDIQINTFRRQLEIAQGRNVPVELHLRNPEPDNPAQQTSNQQTSNQQTSNQQTSNQSGCKQSTSEISVTAQTAADQGDIQQADSEETDSYKAHHLAFELLKEFAPFSRGVDLHCFTSNWEVLKPFIDLGCSVGFGGAATFKRSADIRDAFLQTLKQDKTALLTETDAPYMAPEPLRGFECEPAMVRLTHNYLLNLLCEMYSDPGECAEAQKKLSQQLWTNASEFFVLSTGVSSLL